MPLTFITPPADGYAVTEPFGVKGEAEMLLRNMVEISMVEGFVPYSPALSQKLRKAAETLRESNGSTFTFEKCGQDYREVAYAIKRTLKNGTEKTINVQRKFLNVEAIRIVNVQAEADAAIVADAS